ncbi:helix-turn-helix domain-containing protein, partial [Escherichia coli]|nr:helix-turn-helix domain-containing protein [Escherichia coli]
MAGNAVESGRTVTSKVTAILMAFADGTGWSLSGLARITNIPRPTTHRLVTELVAAQLLERSRDGYRVGPALARLRASETTGGPTVARLAPAVLDDLAAVTGRPA